MKNSEHFESKIGFQEIRSDVEKYCANHDSKSYCRKMTFSNNFKFLRSRLQETHECLLSLNSLKDTEHIPLYDVPSASLETILALLKADGAVLNIEEFVTSLKALKSIHRIYCFFLRNDNIDAPQQYPALYKIASNLTDVHDEIRLIENIIDDNGEIKDAASGELKTIRQQLRNISGSVSAAMRKVIASAAAQGLAAESLSPVVRDGRLVLPVEAMHKRSIKGIVHGESSTGRTVFIEPAEIVEINNRQRELQAEEEREIKRILANSTEELRKNYQEITVNFRTLIKLDFVNAKALYAKDIDGVLPHLHPNPEVEWYHAVNPILQKALTEHGRNVVPLNINLDKDSRILIVSGPNAGGKSVTLKTVGLIQYMMQCGLLPPLYSNSHMGMFDNLFIDIGDNQSIENELSTYSSHLRNMKMLLSESTSRTLFLIDEFGSGTEPTIGGAIAEAILLELVEKGAWGIITTHYQNLKKVGESVSGVINGSMVYDRHLMQPLYSLHIGNAGSSFAIEIARKSGLPVSIINKASEIVGQEYIDSDKYLIDINRDKKYWEQKRYDIKVKEKTLDKLIEEWDRSTADLKAQRKKIIDDARREARELLANANAGIERAIKEIKESEADKITTRHHRQNIQNIKESLEKEYERDLVLQQPKRPKKSKTKQPKHSAVGVPAVASFKVGDKVKLNDGDITGDIIELKADKAIVNFGLTKTTVDVSRLRHSNEKHVQKIKISSTLSTDSRSFQQDRRYNYRNEIDVRGMKVDEALQAVTYFLDDTIQYNVPLVKILHGTGTGALRQAIRELIATYDSRLKFHDEDVRLGGAGITVIELQ